MDQLISHTTPLASLVDELRRSDRFGAFVRALPARARVCENCGVGGHTDDARYCRVCAAPLVQPPRENAQSLPPGLR